MLIFGGVVFEGVEITDLYLRTLFENSFLLSGHHGRQISMDISGIVLVMDTNLLELLKDCKEFLMEDSSYQSVVAGICLFSQLKSAQDPVKQDY